MLVGSVLSSNIRVCCQGPAHDRSDVHTREETLSANGAAPHVLVVIERVVADQDLLGIERPAMVVQIENRVLNKVTRPIGDNVGYLNCVGPIVGVDGISGTAPRRNELAELQLDEQRGEINTLNL